MPDILLMTMEHVIGNIINFFEKFVDNQTRDYSYYVPGIGNSK